MRGTIKKNRRNCDSNSLDGPYKCAFNHTLNEGLTAASESSLTYDILTKIFHIS